MRNYWKFGVLLSLFAAPVLADGPRSGQWEITAKSEMEGMPVSMPAQKVSICIDKANTESGRPPIIADKSCSFSDYKASQGEASWKMHCTRQMEMTGTGHIKFTDNEYSGSSEMVMDAGEGSPMKMKQVFSAKRLGDC